MEITRDQYLMAIQTFRCRENDGLNEADSDLKLFTVLLKRMVEDLRGCNEATPSQSPQSPPAERYSGPPGHIPVRDILNLLSYLDGHEVTL